MIWWAASPGNRRASSLCPAADYSLPPFCVRPDRKERADAFSLGKSVSMFIFSPTGQAAWFSDRHLLASSSCVDRNSAQAPVSLMVACQ